MPSFVTFDPIENIYLINPTNPLSHMGTFYIFGKLSDSKMETDFKFKVIVYNDPPYFKDALVSDINVEIG